MSEQLEKFRNRLRTHDKSAVASRSWRTNWAVIAGLTVSLVALLISGLSLYLGALRQTDELRVAFSRVPILFFAEHARTLGVLAAADLTFINSGTRAIAIRNIHATFFRPHSQSEAHKECDSQLGGDTIMFAYEFEPFVLKAGEIAVRELTRIRSDYKWTVGDKSNRNAPYARLPSTEEPQTNFKLGDHVVTCIDFAISTPGSHPFSVKVPIYGSAVLDEPSKGILTYLKTSYNPKETPISLFRRSGTLFDN